MPPEESHYARDWLRVAEKDWGRLERALDDGDAEEAGFWLQQAVEKYLKAYLLSEGWRLRRVHDLEVLVNEAAAHTPGFAQYARACRKITGYYIIERYPMMNPPSLTVEEVSRSRDDVLGLVESIRQERGRG
jgi:HEPN domain-containing protein